MPVAVGLKLSPNFTFGELTNTNHTSLLAANRREAEAFLDAGRALATTILQPIRKKKMGSIED
jgi:hypothetical protein